MCGDCSNYNVICKNIGKCKFANKRSVSLYTIKIRNMLKRKMGKKVVQVVLKTEVDCPLKTPKEVVNQNVI